MEGKSMFLLFCIATVALAFPAEDAKLVTESKPTQEFVFVQSSGSGARPISRKEKTEDKKHFETAHKLPPSLLFQLNDEDVPEKVPVKPIKHAGKKVHKRQAAESPAPAPPGAIKLNIAQLLEKYKPLIKSSTEEPTTTTRASTTKASRRRLANRRSRRAAPGFPGPTTQTSVLTTSKISPKSIDTDVVGSASEKQRSRIQIKKGPNGQEYEYEYVYYYYDEDEEPKNKISNSHDGPAKNSISRGDKAREKPTPEANEVLPSRSKSRSRQLGEEDPVQEERLPANTRFPPRSRNLNTTPLPEEESKSTAGRGRGRGKPQAAEASSAAPEEDNVSDETQGSRGRTRANLHRPSLELVDSETFNTHSAAQPATAQSPSFPAQLPAGPEEPADKPERAREPAAVSEQTDETSRPNQEDAESTTIATGMNKVALDLYAISQGTQKLFGEEGSELSTEDRREETDATTQDSLPTDETEATTPTTTSSTTTTTTTPAPTTTTRTTTTTTEAPTKASRFGGRRNGLSARKSSSTTTEATSSTESRPKKFGRPGGFGGRSRIKTTKAPAVEEEVNKEESKSVSQSKPTRSRFGGNRSRGRTTAAPEESSKEESSTSSPSTANHRPSLPRARPGLNAFRARGRTTTTAPASEESSSDSEISSTELSSTTTSRPARRIAGAHSANIKPLRPGPRINLAGRRGAQTTTTSTEASNSEEDHHITGDEEETHAEAASEKEEAPAPAPVDNSPLGRLRNKNRINIQPRAKAGSAASASAQVQVRRVNPLLNRRRPGQTTEAPSSEAPSSEATETEAEEPAAETEPAPSSTTTTEEPRGLNKLLAGRRRLATRTPGTINHK